MKFSSLWSRADSFNPASSLEGDQEGAPAAHRRATKWLQAAGVIVAIAIAGLSLVAWWMGYPLATAFGHETLPVAPSTAWMIMALGLALTVEQVWPLRAAARHLHTAIVALVLLVGGTVIVQDSAGLGSPWEDWLTGTQTAVRGIPVGRMSPFTAGILLLAALSLQSLQPAWSRRANLRRASKVGAALGGGFCLLISLAYATGTPLFYGSGVIPMSWATAVALDGLLGALLLASGANYDVRRFLFGDVSSDVLKPTSREWWFVVGLGAAFLFAIAFGATWYLRKEQIREKARIARELDAIATLKVQQIAAWRTERLQDARQFMQTLPLGRDFNMATDAAAWEERRNEWLRWMEPMVREDGYDALALVNSQGRILVATSTLPDGELAMEALLRRLPGAHDVLESDIFRGKNGQMYIDLLAPILTPPGGQLAGAMLLCSNVQRTLFAALQTWPTPNNTAEARLISRDGDDVVFLSPSRHGPDPQLGSRRSTQEPTLLAAQVVRGDTHGLLEGVDSRGVRVIGTGRRVPNAPWFIVVKMDQEEAFAPLRREAAGVTGLAIALLGLAVLSIAVAWRERRLDIIQRALAAETTRRALATRLALVTQHVNDAIFIMDASGRILEANERALALYGYTLEELQSLPPGGLRTAEVANNLALELELFSDPKGVVFESVHRRKDGLRFPVEISGSEFFDTDGRRLKLAVLRDITERKAAHAHKEQLSAIVDSSDDAIIGEALDGIVTSWNRGAEKLFGYAVNEIVGRSIGMLFPQDRLGELADLLGCVSRGEHIEQYETVRRHKDGRQIDVSVTISPVKETNGRFTGAAKVIRDITTLKRREREVVRLNRLYAALSHINQTIVHANTRDELFVKCCRGLVELGGFQMAWIGWRDSVTQEVVPVASCGDDGGYLRAIRIFANDRPEGRGPTGSAVRECRTYVCDDFCADPNTLPWRELAMQRGFRSSIALPVTLGGKVVGALTAYGGAPGFFGAGEVALFEEAAADISFALDNFEREAQRQRAEQQVRESEQRWRMALSSIHAGVWDLDLSDNTSVHSRRHDEIFGYHEPPPGWTYEKFLEHVVPQDRVRVDETFCRALQRQTSSEIECGIRWPDGEQRWIRVSGEPYTNPRGHPGTLGIVEDITQRKVREERLNLLETAVLAAPNCVMITDARGTIEWVNPAFTQITGYQSADAIGQTPRILRSGRQSAGFYATMWGTIKRGQSWHGEFVNRRKDGSHYHEEATIAPVRDAAGVITHFVSIAEDITSRKEAEQRVREQAALLDKTSEAIIVGDLDNRITFWNRGAERLFGWSAAEMLGQRADKLLSKAGVSEQARVRVVLTTTNDWRGEVRGSKRDGTALVTEVSITILRDEAGQPTGRLGIVADVTEKKALEERFLRAQRLESLGMLAAGISHDLNNVLAPICMAVELMRSRTTESADLRLLNTLDKCSERGVGLVKQILGFAQGVGGEPRLLQVKHLMRDIAGVIIETFPKSIVLKDEVPNDLWPILGNATQIHQVLLNLCVNARDAMPDGGTLHLRGENCILDVTAAKALGDGAQPGRWLALLVEDTGTGIAPEILARIWEPFFTTKSADKGTGLGLSTVRGIVEAHHGFVTLQTTLGCGTTFHIYLPAVESADSGIENAGPASLIRGQGELILFVDDEELIRETGSSILQRAGYRVVTASDGLEAIAQFNNFGEQFSVVVTDLDMPNVGGGKLARLIRAAKPATGIITMSGIASRGMNDRPDEFADTFLGKPFTADALLRSIGELLREHRALTS